MSFGAYIANLYTQLGLIGLFATCLFAWMKGGAPERMGTLLSVVAWLGADLARGLSHALTPTTILFASDVLVSLGFLFISVRYSSLWLGLAMLFQSFAFATHAVQLGDTDAPRWHGMIIYLLLNNVLSYLVLLTLAGGTVATVVKRARDRKAHAKARARAALRPVRRFIIPPPPIAGTP
jgi:hypothetical protein